MSIFVFGRASTRDREMTQSHISIRILRLADSKIKNEYKKTEELERRRERGGKSV